MENEQKYALITGGTIGIGYELAKLFAKDKYNLIIVARKQEELDKAATEFRQQYGVEVISISKDLSKREEVFQVCEEVKRKGIQVDVLVNNAGQGQYGEFVDTDIHRDIQIIDLNVIAYTILTQHFLKEMVARNEGKILNVSSIGGEMPGPLQGVYHATKAYVTSLTEAIYNEIKDTGVTITALLPGVTDTDFFRKADMEEAKMVKEGSKADPAKVAQDGYEALMAGKDKIVSGFMNKVMVAASNLMPDSTVADMSYKQTQPSDKKDEK